MVLRVKSFVFKEHSLVIFFCPRISKCRHFCSTYRKYEGQGYDIICLNPDFYSVEDIDRILKDELKRRRELRMCFSLPPSS